MIHNTEMSPHSSFTSWQARPAIVSSRSVSAKGLLTLRLTRLPGELVVFSPSSALEMSSQGHLRDSYEDSKVYLAPSNIPGADEGLFARQDYPPNTLVSFYHGLNVPYDIEDFTNDLHAFDEVESKTSSESPDMCW